MAKLIERNSITLNPSPTDYHPFCHIYSCFQKNKTHLILEKTVIGKLRIVM